MSVNTNQPIAFSFAGLGDGYCFTTPERFALDIVNAMTGYLPGQYSVIINSESEPGASDRSKLWSKLFPGGAPSGKIFQYYLGKWVMPNPVEAEAQSRIWFEGSEADAWSYDGGDGTDPSSSIPTATTGAMWKVDHNYDFRFPLAAGTSPKPTTVSPGQTGGAEEVTQTVAQMAAHAHTTDINPYVANSYGGNGGITTGNIEPEGTIPLLPTSTVGGDASNVTQPMPNMPPWRSGFWLVRTARIYYVA